MKKLNFTKKELKSIKIRLDEVDAQKCADNQICPYCKGFKYEIDIESNNYLLPCDMCMETGIYNT